MATTNLKILIVAKHASACFGGEAILPLHYFMKLRQRGVDAWLLVNARTRDELENECLSERTRIIYVPDDFVHRVLSRLRYTLPTQAGDLTFGFLQDLYTQLQQRKRIKRVVSELDVDLVHEPIPVSPKAPSLTFGFGVPVVLGPMNGGMSYPAAFAYMQSRASRRLMRTGRWLADFLNVLLPGKRKATTLLVANERTRSALPRWHSPNVEVLVENGVDLELWQPPLKVRAETEGSSPDSKIKFAFVGRLVDWKAVDLLLEAFKRVASNSEAILDIIGDGPMHENLKSLAQHLGVLNRINFCGWLTQRECSKRLQSTDILVLPSLYECGGAVVLEAMALSMPVIATNWGGPADYIDSTCGILVEPSSRSDLIAGLASAMERLADDPELRRSMGLAGRARVEKYFTWDRKIDSIIDVYHRACAMTRSH